MNFCRFLLVAGFILLNATIAHADMASYLWELNASAWGDPAAYQREIQERFKVSAAEFGNVRQRVATPAEIAVVLWLSERTGEPVADLLRTCQAYQGDWEQVALAAGFSPGSDDFNALHYGELGWSPVGAARYGSLAEYAQIHAGLK